MKTSNTFFIKGLFFVCVNFAAQNVFADHCPSIEDITYRLISKDYEWTVDKTQFRSKSQNTPFEGWKLKGKVFGLYNKGMWWQA